MEQKTVTTVFPDNLRSSRPEVFLKKDVLKNSRELPKNHAWWSDFNSKNLLIHGIAEDKEEITDEVIINTLNEKLDLDITLRDIERTHRIRELKKTRGKIRPIIVKFVRYNDWNIVFRNKKKLKGQKISITESLTKIRMDKLRQAKEIYGFTNVWTNDGKLFFKSDSNAKPQVYYS